MNPTYLIDGLSILHTKLGSPKWYWPAVMFVIFVALPLLASAIENGATN